MHIRDAYSEIFKELENEKLRLERFSLHMVILINATHIFVNYKVNSKLAFIISQTNYIYHITLQSLIN